MWNFAGASGNGRGRSHRFRWSGRIAVGVLGASYLLAVWEVYSVATRKPPSTALELFRLRLQLCQFCQIRPRVPSIIERRASAVDAGKAILDPQNTRGNPSR